MVHGGLCLAHDDAARPMLVEGGIPGEEVEVSVRYRKGSTSFAEVVRVLEASPHRVDAAVSVRARVRRVSAAAHRVRAPGGAETRHRARRAAPAAHRAPGAARARASTIPGGIASAVSSTSSPAPTGSAAGARLQPGAQLAPDRGRRLPDPSSAHHHGAARAARPDRTRARPTALGTLHLTVGEDGQELLVRAEAAAWARERARSRRARPAGRRSGQHDVDDVALARA